MSHEEISAATERKRVFKFYKQLPIKSRAEMEELDAALGNFVVSIPVTCTPPMCFYPAFKLPTIQST